jgi:hypothetical protein
LPTTQRATERDAFGPRQINLYEVLQVSSQASPEVIQAAYRVLARSYHPDVNASPNAARLMRQLNAAYGVLGDPERRARYDTFRARGRVSRVASATNPRPASGPARGTDGGVARSVVSQPVVIGSTYRYARAALAVVVLLAAVGAMIFALWVVLGVIEDQTAHLVSPRPGAQALARSTVSQPRVYAP